MSLPNRILWLTWKDRSHPLAGGAEVVNEAIAQRLVRAGAQVVFIVGGFDGGGAVEERDGYRIERVGNRFTCYYHAWRKVRRDYRGWADLVIDEVNTVPFFAGWYAGKKRRGVGMHDVPSSACQGEELEVRIPLNPSSQPSPLRGEGASDGMHRGAAAGLGNGKIPVILFVHQLCRQIWFYQLPWSVAWVGYLLEPLYLRLLSRFPAVTVSESTKRDLMRYGFREDRVSVISEGITLEPVDELCTNTPPSSLRSGYSSREENHTSASESSRESVTIPSLRKVSCTHEGRCSKALHPTLLILGAIREMKRTDHALRAYELARDVIPDLKLVIAGGNGSAYGQEVMRRIAASRHASDITYEGRVDEARKTELMRTSHVLLSCAVKEGWGLTITEANSQGIPAIVYDADGLRDSVRHGQTGLVCRPTPQAMAAAVVSLLSDHATYERLRRTGWEWSKAMTFDRAAEDFVAALSALLDPPMGDPTERSEGGGGFFPADPLSSYPLFLSDNEGSQPLADVDGMLRPAAAGLSNGKNSVPLVSVIVPTLNSAKTLERCLMSIRAQTYPAIELIVVDNFSTDDTMDIAQRLADKVYQQGPERSAQVNYGVEQATGQYVYKVDSDFVLEPTVVEECVAKMAEGYDAVVVHNTPDATISYLARIRKFEVDMYKYDLGHSAARFLRKSTYLAIGGFNPAITAGEDYDFQNRLNRAGYKTGFIDAEALHLGEPRRLYPHLRKFYDYGRDFVHYAQENKQESGQQLGFFRPVYFRNWRRFLRHPLTGAAFVLYHCAKFGAGGLGLVMSKLSSANKRA